MTATTIRTIASGICSCCFDPQSSCVSCEGTSAAVPELALTQGKKQPAVRQAAKPHATSCKTPCDSHVSNTFSPQLPISLLWTEAQPRTRQLNISTRARRLQEADETAQSAYHAPGLQRKHEAQRVHVGIWYILRAQRGSHIPTLRAKYIPYSYMDPLGRKFQQDNIPAETSKLR